MVRHKYNFFCVFNTQFCTSIVSARGRRTEAGNTPAFSADITPIASMSALRLLLDELTNKLPVVRY